MAKYKRRVQQALAARRDAWAKQSPDQKTGTRNPGSQNRTKTGFDQAPKKEK